MWRFRLAWVETVFLHSLQVNDFSPVCIFKCTISCDLQENVFLHLSHVNGPSPGCNFIICNISIFMPWMLNFNPDSSSCDYCVWCIWSCSRLFKAFNLYAIFLCNNTKYFCSFAYSSSRISINFLVRSRYFLLFGVKSPCALDWFVTLLKNVSNIIFLLQIS